VTLTLHKMGRLHQDLEYIKSFNGHRAPCNVTFDSKKGKYSKVPAVARWTEITPESADKLEAEGWDGHKHCRRPSIYADTMKALCINKGEKYTQLGDFGLASSIQLARRYYQFV
jgi:hypothetical protein